jgi:dolichyl-phosphate beta-glucosyltransferase
LQTNEDVGFVFVDDGSTDNTSEIIDRIVKSFPNRVVGIRNLENMGKAESVRKGVLFSKNISKYIGYWDADLSTPLFIINTFSDVLDKQDVCLIMGSRIKMSGHEIIRKNYRHYLGRVFATLASLIVGQNFYDTQCGAKLFTSEVSESCFEKPFLSRWCFDIEIIIRLLDMQTGNNIENKIIELPLKRWVDGGDTRIKLTEIIFIAVDLVRIYIIKRKGRKDRGQILQ